MIYDLPAPALIKFMPRFIVLDGNPAPDPKERQRLLNGINSEAPGGSLRGYYL